MYVFQTDLLDENNSKFTCLNSNFHSYNMRHKNDYCMFSRRLKFTTVSPYVRGIKLYNLLHENIKSLTGNSYKTELKNWLIEKTPCTFDDI
jgi:hypothetical protein